MGADTERSIGSVATLTLLAVKKPARYAMQWKPNARWLMAMTGRKLSGG